MAYNESMSKIITTLQNEPKKKKKLTVNGFTEEFEEKVLKAAAEPIENDIVLETEEDIRNYFLHLRKPKQKN